MSPRVSRRRPWARREGAARVDDAGMTLTELLVAMGLSMIIGAMTLGMFVNISDTTRRSIDRTVTSSAARNAIQAWTSYLRVADGPAAGSRVSRVEWLTDHDMLFYADLFNRSLDTVATTGAPTMLWLRRDTANRLIEEQFASSATAGTRPTVCRTLVDNVVGGAPLFTGTDSKSNPITAGTAPAAGSGCQALPVTVPSQQKNPDLTAQATLENLYAVTIDFIVNDTTGKHPIEFKSQAVLPSLGAAG